MEPYETLEIVRKIYEAPWALRRHARYDGKHSPQRIWHRHGVSWHCNACPEIQKEGRAVLFQIDTLDCWKNIAVELLKH